MLRDTTCFTGGDAGVADRIQKRSFTVVNVAHDRDDRGTCFQRFGIVFCFLDHVFDVRVRNTGHFVTKLFDDQFCCVGVDGLVLRDHHTHIHERFDHITDALRHPNRQL